MFDTVKHCCLMHHSNEQSVECQKRWIVHSLDWTLGCPYLSINIYFLFFYFNEVQMLSAWEMLCMHFIREHGNTAKVGDNANVCGARVQHSSIHQWIRYFHILNGFALVIVDCAFFVQRWPVVSLIVPLVSQNRAEMCIQIRSIRTIDVFDKMRYCQLIVARFQSKQKLNFKFIWWVDTIDDDWLLWRISRHFRQTFATVENSYWSVFFFLFFLSLPEIVWLVFVSTSLPHHPVWLIECKSVIWLNDEITHPKLLTSRITLTQ